MEALRMQVKVDSILFQRAGWELRASGTFEPGTHLISGSVGSGKSTLALLLAGLVAPISGRIIRDGIEKSLLSLQFPEYHVTGETIQDEIRSWGSEVDVILRDAEMEGRGSERVFSLSRGELKRLHLSCVLAGGHDLLILDEPFSTLDCVQKNRLCRRLEEAEKRITIIFTHEQAVLPAVDYIWEMEDGLLTPLGPVAGAIPHWKGAPAYLTAALEEGALPENIRLRDAMEAICRMHA